MGVTEQVLQARLAKLKQAEWDSDSDEDSIVQENSNDSTTMDFEQQPAFVPVLEKNSTVTMTAVENVKTKTSKKMNKVSNVVYLGHIPHGFYEEQMKGFFGQFGEIARIRLARNRKTGKSKHYAFLQFTEAAVAEIVVSTMHNYRLFDHTLQCSLIPTENVHEKMFQGCNKPFRMVPYANMAREQHNASRSLEQQQKQVARLLKKEAGKRKALHELDIDYEFAGYQACVPSAPKHVKYQD